MRVITLHQPWASLLACGAKQFETRSWKTSFRGPMLIHASKKYTLKQKMVASQFPFKGSLPQTPDGEPCNIHKLPTGAIIGVAEFIECFSCEGWQFKRWIEENDPNMTGLEWYFGDFGKGRYAWQFKNARLFKKPYPCRGQQRIWNLDDKIAKEIH